MMNKMLIACSTLVSACSLLPNDNPMEEFVEKEIRELTGGLLDIDFTSEDGD